MTMWGRWDEIKPEHEGRKATVKAGYLFYGTITWPTDDFPVLRMPDAARSFPAEFPVQMGYGDEAE